MIRLGLPLTPEDVHAVAHGAPVALGVSLAPPADAGDGRGILAEKWRFLMGQDAPPGDLVEPFLLGHCAGAGAPLPVPAVRAMMLARAQVLSLGYSGVGPDLVGELVGLLNEGLTPVVPSQGSVGAAGDLAPLAHVARVVAGLGGAVTTRDGALLPRSPRPGVRPSAREALALINGSTLSTALAALAVVRADRVLSAMEAACAMTMEALRADTRTLDPRAAALRPHPGEVAVAARLLALRGGPSPVRPADAFSLRAAPAVLGAARDALRWVRDTVTLELASVCDNPVDVDGDRLEVGHFHGAPLALGMDTLRIALTAAASQSERRTFRLVSNALTEDLPSFLVQGTGLNSGFMLAQYTAASLVSECKGLSHPASVDTVPTMQHREDHVSMAPIAGRLTLRVLEAVADVTAIEVLLATEALDWRRSGRAWRKNAVVEVEPQVLPAALAHVVGTVRADVPAWTEDRELHPAIAAVGRLVRGGAVGTETVGPW